MHTRIGMNTLSPSTINRWIDRSNQINLSLPAYRRRRRQARTRLVVACVALAVVAALAVRYLWRSYGL